MECIFRGFFFRDLWRVAVCMIILIILGPILFIIGISVLVSAPLNNTRAHNLEAANAVVTDWNSFNKAVWENITVYVDTNSPGYTDRYVLPQVRGGSREVFDSSVHTYEPVKYQDSNLLWPDSPTQYTLYYYVNPSNPNTSIETVNVLPQYTITSDQPSSDNKACQDDGGTYFSDQQICEYNYILDEICVKFSQSGSIWQAETSPGSDIGCFYHTPAGDWSPFHYKKVPSLSAFSAPDVLVTARSADDPFIHVQEITKGTGDFGLTKAQTAATGLGLMIVGIIFMLPCFFFVGCTVYYYNYRKDRQ